MAAKKPATTTKAPAAEPETVATTSKTTSPNTAEAKSRFNAALDEAKAGAAALGDEAKARVGAYRDKAKSGGQDWSTEAKATAGNLANEGKHKASEAMTGLSRVIDENAASLDEKLGPKYGDYARSASKSLQDNARKLDEKSIDELAEESREAIRKSPAAAVGLAALVGFFFARLFR